MAKQRYVWRGRRRQKLRALHRQLDRVKNKRDPHFQAAYRVFTSSDIGGNFGTLLTRAALLLSLKETIPEVPAVTP